MRVLIIEDELPAANRLASLLQNIHEDMEVIKNLDSISAAVKFIPGRTDIDLIFMDIQLADGLSFDIFQQIAFSTPVIFTTAFDSYTLKAFKVNSIDYLLKPIDEDELKNAVAKYNQFFSKKEDSFSENIKRLLQEMQFSGFKERLMIKRGQQLGYLRTKDIAYCFADGKLCYTVDFNGSKFLLENNLTQLEEQLKPSQFFRINRHLLINIDAVSKVHTWFGSRLKLELTPSAALDTLVSRERVQGFRKWLGE